MKRQEDLLVISNTELNKNCFLLKLKTETSLSDIMAGQFVNVLVKDVQDRILRRPISIHDVDMENNILSIVVQKVGKSTNKLSEIKAMDKLSVVYPLGNSFPMDEKRPLLIGGGVGTAPLYYVAKKYNDQNIRPTILIGAKTKEQLFLIDKYEQVADVKISTEDGSIGEKGLVTTNSILEEEFSAYLVCGPHPMMKAVYEMASKKDIKCFVSLENRMACGIGACLCCVTDTKDMGNVCVCTYGPVFDANEIKW